LKKTEQLPSTDNSEPLKKRPSGIMRVAAYFVAILLIFGVGFAAGRGDLKVRNELASSGNQSLPADLNYTSVEEVYDLLKASYDGSIDSKKLVEGLKRGLVAAANDPYTEYFNPEEAKSFNDSLKGTFTGIGAELGKNSEDQIIIVAPLSGYPAEKAGLEPEDIIVAIDGKSASNLSLTEAVRKIRGEAGTKVTLTVIRGSDKPFDVEITRAKIELPSVEYKIEGDIGYLKINQFSDDTAAKAREAAQAFKAKGVKGVILDLRGNPGGYLSGAVDVSSLWLKEGTTVVSERRSGKVASTEKAHGTSPLNGVPTIVLIDKGSASASEITAGALRDHGAAKLVGVTSFGKGSVQRIDELGDGGEIKITIAHWFTPKGTSIDEKGIKPDFEVKASEQAGSDPQRDKARELLN